MCIRDRDNIAAEKKVKSELGVVFDTNYFSDDWKVSQVEKSFSVFYPNWDSQKFADMLRKFHIVPTKEPSRKAPVPVSYTHLDTIRAGGGFSLCGENSLVLPRRYTPIESRS